MFGTFNPDGRRARLKFNGLTMNDDTNQDSMYQVDIVALGQTFDAVQEAHALKEGMESHRPRTVTLLVTGSGTVQGSSVADLYDKIMALNNAFNPVEIWRKDTATLYNRGFLKFTGWLPTADTANYGSGSVPSGWAHPDANFAAGEIPVFALVRSVRLPVERVSDLEGNATDFRLTLQAADPRLYYGIAQSANRTGDGTISIANTLAKVPSPAVVTIVTTSTPRTVDLTYDGKTLNTSLPGSSTVIVDMEHHEVYVNGALDMSVVTGGTFWDDILPTTQNVTIASSGGTSYQYTVSWYRALA